MADKINVHVCLIEAQHLQRIATKCVVFIEQDPFICAVNVAIISEGGDIFIYKFSVNNSFMENADELQRLKEKFYQLNGEEEDNE